LNTRKLVWIGVFLAGLCSFSCKIAKDLELRDWDAGDGGNCECKAEDGPCCKGCDYYQASDNQVCETVYAYRCDSINCGASAQSLTGTKKCQGGMNACTGDLEWEDWEILDPCNSDQICQTDGDTYATCTTCEHGCAEGACWPECNPDLPTCDDGDLCTEPDTCNDTGFCIGEPVTCDHGCDPATGNCWPICNPSDPCCASDGTWKTDEVRQPETNLNWMRCALGQTWQEGSECACLSAPQTETWCTAMGESAGVIVCPTPVGTNICESTLGAGYRLPTPAEFMDLLGGCSDMGGYYDCDSCAESANCSDMLEFDDDGSWYWSFTYDDSDNAWRASFTSGDVNLRDTRYYHRVWCLRTGS
jgi:hypothetical protein